MNSDYDRWFICTDGSAIKCKRERFSDFLKDLLGAEKAAKAYPLYRKATFSENSRLELELTEE